MLASEEGAEVRRYLEKRGFPPEAQERFGLGYAPGGLGPAPERGAPRARST